MPLKLMTRRLTDTDKTSAVIYKLTDSCGNGRILPDAATGMSSIPISHINNHIQVFENFRFCQNIVKRNKMYIKGCTT